MMPFTPSSTMPSADFFMWFQEDLTVLDRWMVNGKNYGRTSNEWLKKMDSSKTEIMELFKTCYGDDQAAIWFQRWRMFYLACAETFDFQGPDGKAGEEWFVTHYLFKRK